jgi:1-acyl-sn-glycerol-3-phosphate acyltransferase
MPSLLALAIATLLFVSASFLLPGRDPKPEIRGRLRPLWWIDRAYCAFWHRLETERAPLPEHGPAILVANHTCGIDHLLLQAGCARVLGFMVAQEYYDHWLCRPFCRLIGCIPVRRDGRDISATRAALRALKEGRVVPIFPEGRIIPTSGREIGEGKSGAAFIALHSGVPVIPGYIRGTPPTNDVWKALYTPSDARVVYGPPIDLSGLSGGDRPDKEALDAATERIMAAIHALRARSLPDGSVPQGERGQS